MTQSRKFPQAFKVGDTIKYSPTIPYSGSPITQVNVEPDETMVWFQNGEAVRFKNGIVHEMQE